LGTALLAGAATAVRAFSQGKIVASGIAYHPFGGVKSWADGAGQIHERQQDQDGRVSRYTLGGAPWILSYDEAGRITGQIDGSNAAQSALYGYVSCGSTGYTCINKPDCITRFLFARFRMLARC
jgi:YD repeat-containing protein